MTPLKQARIRPIRNMDAGDLIELTLVVAVATVVIIRVILELSGYPQLGGGGLHIAHVLYGGLMMIGALIVVFTFLNQAARWAAAFVGGVGFGFFIDEVGKFITSDVNYFFEPAIAVMYVVFVILFFALYAVRRQRLRPHDALANALGLLREERDGTIDPESRRELLALLDQADPADPLVEPLRRRVEAMPVRERRSLTPYQRWRGGLAAWYRQVAARRWYSALVLTLMVLFALGSLTVLLDLVGEGTGVDGDAGNANVADWVQGISSGVSAVLIGIGLAVRHRSRVAAYRWFKAAIMVSLLVTQVFVFYHDQLAALIGVILDLLLYAGLTYMIGREEAHRDAAQAPAAAPAAAPVA